MNNFENKREKKQTNTRLNVKQENIVYKWHFTSGIQ